MEFYIVVKNNELGEIKSETYKGEKTEYEKVISEIPKATKLDFYDEDGNYVVISENIISNSLIYIKES